MSEFEGGQTQEDGAVSTRRGRPRPQETMERDGKVKDLLADGPKTTQQLAESLGVANGIAYLSIYRLKRDGSVVKTQASEGRNPAWQLAGASV